MKPIGSSVSRTFFKIAAALIALFGFFGAEAPASALKFTYLDPLEGPAFIHGEVSRTCYRYLCNDPEVNDSGGDIYTEYTYGVDDDVVGSSTRDPYNIFRADLGSRVMSVDATANAQFREIPSLDDGVFSHFSLRYETNIRFTIDEDQNFEIRGWTEQEGPGFSSIRLIDTRLGPDSDSLIQYEKPRPWSTRAIPTTRNIQLLAGVEYSFHAIADSSGIMRNAGSARARWGFALVPPVPEPGTALLLGLGLIGLSRSHPRSGA